MGMNARTEAAREAFQDRWNDWCSDTGDHPDFVQHHGRELLSLDTCVPPFDDFMASALTAADAADAPLAEKLAAALRTFVGDESIPYETWIDRVEKAHVALAEFDAARADSQGTATAGERHEG